MCVSGHIRPPRYAQLYTRTGACESPEYPADASLSSWITRIDKTETLPDDIKALNFGLIEPYGIELIGSASYDEDGDDWACDEDFEPDERECPALHIDEEEDWEDVLDMIVSILKELVQESKGIQLFSVDHITAGFCDGDLVVIK